MRRAALLAIVLLAAVTPSAQQQPRDSSSPNVVLIITDDVGYGDFGSYWKLMGDGDHVFLFDLGKDPGERNDLSQQRPDLIASLRARLAEWEKDVETEAKSK